MRKNQHVLPLLKSLPVAAGLLLFFLAVAGCSTVNISNLHTRPGHETSPAQLNALASFDLLPLDLEQPFSEQIALDAVRASLLNRGYRFDPANPDFLVAVWYAHDYRANSHFRITGQPIMGWYNPGFNNSRWPGHGAAWAMRNGSYTVIRNYAALSIAFINPEARKTIGQNQGGLETASSVPGQDILWLGQAYTHSSRNAFTALSCLAAAILEEFPGSGEAGSKSIELARCY